MSLNNLSNRQTDTGDRDAALASITEAVDIRRRLAAANPAAYLPDLARSLNNLSNQQTDTGDRDAALASITEAVDTTAGWPRPTPPPTCPTSPMSLNNLSIRQSDTGDRDAALASITEAVDIRRRLAAANPAAYLPDLAVSLNNLSNRQADTGDRDAALASITEAVEHYRRLAAANPAAYLPDLATSLNNLSNRQCRHRRPRRRPGLHHRSRRHYRRARRGQPRRLPARPRRVAEQPVQPAGRHRRPGRRPGLHHRSRRALPPAGRGQPRRLPARPRHVAEQPVRSLGRLSDLPTRLEPGPAGNPTACGTSRTTDSLGSGSAGRHSHDAARRRTPEPRRPTARPDTRRRTAGGRAGDARPQTHPVAGPNDLSPLPDLPHWATASIADEHIELVNAYAAATGGPTGKRSSPPTKNCSPRRVPHRPRRTRRPVPGQPHPGELLALLDEIDERASRPLVATAPITTASLLNAWINTPTWTESQTFLAEHRRSSSPTRSSTCSPTPTTTPPANTSPSWNSHRHPGHQVYAMVVDPSRAETAALDAIESGDIPLLSVILTVSPNLAVRPIAWGVAVAVLLLDQGDKERAKEFAQAVADQATPMQRRAHAIRLRSLAARQPDLSGVAEILAILAEQTVT